MNDNNITITTRGISVTNTGTNTGVMQIFPGGDYYDNLSYRELHVQLRQLFNQRLEIAKGKRSRALKFWLVTQVLSLLHELSSSHPSLASLGIKAGGFALVMLLLALLPDTTEMSIRGKANQLEIEIDRRNADFRTYHTGHKFYGGQRIYCERLKQYGVLVSPARLRVSDMRVGLNPPRDPHAIPSYDFLADNGDSGTFPETDYQDPIARTFEKASAWVDKHKALLMLVMAILGLLATVLVKLVGSGK